MITSQVLARRDALAEEFRDAVPFRHAVIDDFFDPSLCRSLLSDFPNFEERYALNEMGEVGGKAVRMDVRDISDAYRDVDQYLQTTGFLDFVSTITGIPDLLYDPDYIGGGTHENRDGQGLDQHVDFNFHPRTRWHRRLNLIVYLNPEWEDAWGGNLQLQADPWNGDTRGPSVAPLFNRAVIFETTERSWHGFSTIHLPDEKKALSRKSFAIYLYTTQRPAQETAASHATIYVPDRLPDDLRPGDVLDADRIDDLRQRFDRAFGQLKFLYDREKQFSTQISALENALTQARGAMRVPLQGYALQSGAPTGMWPDGWVGTTFSMRFTPQKKLRGVQLELWAPDRLDSDQTLSIELDGKRWTHYVARGSRSRLVLKTRAPAGRELQLTVRAERSFVPAQVGQSTDARDLAWKLLGAALEH
ncbi:MAG: 2OG-Fe(II) oxygenase [Rudaea sp.]